MSTHMPIEQHRQRRGRKLYDRAAWRKRLRPWFLARHPLCSDPYGHHREDGRVVAATDIDHVVPIRERPDLAYDTHNLQALCHRCHSLKTREEQRRGGGSDPSRCGLNERAGGNQKQCS